MTRPDQAASVPPIGRHVLFAYLPPEHAHEGAELAVEYFGERYPVRVIAVGATPPWTLGGGSPTPDPTSSGSRTPSPG